jgi:SAM-dependent methyltransferase
MKLAVVTPIGPGHENAYSECLQSIEIAWRHNAGPFTALEILPQWDLEGRFGRSERRNRGIEQAAAKGCDWIFFIDADDIMTPFALEDVTTHLNEYDAVWGAICEAPFNDNQKMALRENQLGETNSIYQLLDIDPYLSIQMGHFVKVSCAACVGFDEAMNTGEDFRYYLRLWELFKCKKTNAIFFLNRRGNHSIGLKSANGVEWRAAVEAELSACKARLKKKDAKSDQGKRVTEMKQPQGKVALIVAHPDDEILWAGGLLSRFTGFDVICCSIPSRDPERALYFAKAMKLLGHHPFILPYTEQPTLIQLNIIELCEYDTIITHNSEGEYGHPHHKQVHEHICQNFLGNIYLFGFGRGDTIVTLNDNERSRKLAALQCYKNKSNADGGLPKWKALLARYDIQFECEHYVTWTAQTATGACGACGAYTNTEIRARSDYQVFGLENAQLVNVGSRMQNKLHALREVIPDFKGKKILDIGCDFGFWSFLAAAQGGEVVGLDRSRMVNGIGLVDIPLLNNQTAQANKFSAAFYGYEAGSQWWDFNGFDIVLCMSLYHHIFNICQDHHTIWYWLSRICGGTLIWENPLNCDDTVVQINLPSHLLPLYNEIAIRNAALQFFTIDFEGPAVHETTRTVWKLSPKRLPARQYQGKAVMGAGGASEAFTYNNSKRIIEIEKILGKRVFPGSLNLILNENFDWSSRYFRATLFDVTSRRNGLDGVWEGRWVRFYPMKISGTVAWGMRFEGENYPENFMEVIATTRLRDIQPDSADFIIEV